MGAIVCATRGGEASRRTQERAIALAKERNAELIFLCVVDPSFAEPVNDALTAALRDELKRMGRSLMCIARARAENESIEAQTVVQSGLVRQEIEDFLRDIEADTLVIGAPRAESTGRAFGLENVHQLAEAIRQSTDVEVIVVT